MLRSDKPNRFFGVNPAGIPSQGRQLTPWSREIPKDWRSALGVDGPDPSETSDDAEPAAADATA